MSKTNRWFVGVIAVLVMAVMGSAAAEAAVSYKWGVGKRIQPFGDPEVIRATEYLPHVGFGGTDFCN